MSNFVDARFLGGGLVTLVFHDTVTASVGIDAVTVTMRIEGLRKLQDVLGVALLARSQAVPTQCAFTLFSDDPGESEDAP